MSTNPMEYDQIYREKYRTESRHRSSGGEDQGEHTSSEEEEEEGRSTEQESSGGEIEISQSECSIEAEYGRVVSNEYSEESDEDVCRNEELLRYKHELSEMVDDESLEIEVGNDDIVHSLMTPMARKVVFSSRTSNVKRSSSTATSQSNESGGAGGDMDDGEKVIGDGRLGRKQQGSSGSRQMGSGGYLWDHEGCERALSGGGLTGRDGGHQFEGRKFGQDCCSPLSEDNLVRIRVNSTSRVNVSGLIRAQNISPCNTNSGIPNLIPQNLAHFTNKGISDRLKTGFQEDNVWEFSRETASTLSKTSKH